MLRRTESPVVRHRGGHAQMKTTKRYLHVAGTLFRDEAQALEALLGSRSRAGVEDAVPLDGLRGLGDDVAAAPVVGNDITDTQLGRTLDLEAEVRAADGVDGDVVVDRHTVESSTDLT